MTELFRRWRQKISPSVDQSDRPKAIADWFDRIGRTSPPPGDIIAFNIGIFETSNGYTIYLAGSREYDPGNDDWACQEDYSPTERYFELSPSYVCGKDWQQLEKDVIALVKGFLGSKPSPETFLANAMVVTAGFDDGELTRIK